jgi:hypothetical protein
MNRKEKSHRTKLFVFSIQTVLFAAAWSIPQLAAAPPGNNNQDDNSPIQVGYVIVTPTPTDTSPSMDIAVFETFGERRGGQTQQAGVLPAVMTTHAVLFINANGRLSRNVGVAIANPSGQQAPIGLRLYRGDGELLAGYATSNSPFVLDPGEQMAKYVTELFDSQPEVERDFTGTLDITSDVPVAVIGIRTRGENFSTLPATLLSDGFPVPPISTDTGEVGGSGAIILAHFAVGGGWTTEIVITNYSEQDEAQVRVDIFDKFGQSMDVTLDGETGHTFTRIIQPHGVTTLAKKDQDGDSGL